MPSRGLHNFVYECCYGCEGFTDPLGREEKSRVKGLSWAWKCIENLGVWAPLYVIIIHTLLGVIREVWCIKEVLWSMGSKRATIEGSVYGGSYESPERTWNRYMGEAPKAHEIYLLQVLMIWKISIFEAHLLPMFMVPLVNHYELSLGWVCSRFEM